MHIVVALLKALDALDEVIALIRASATVEDARAGLRDLLEIDDVQAGAILDMQLRRLAALERQKLVEEHAELEARITDYEDILATPARQRQIVGDELTDIVDRYGDDRRTRIDPFDGDMSNEDLIPVDDVVVTITRGGYAKRTRVDSYRSQKRGGKGVRGASLRGDDAVEHFFTTSTHHWLLFFTNLGRVYRAKAYQLPESARDAKGQHVANLLAFQPGEQIAQVLTLRDYQAADYLVLATKEGRVKKTRLPEYDSNRSGGLIAINLREVGEPPVEDDAPVAGERDELVGASLVGGGDDIVLVSRKGQSLRFSATDEALRPMGRSTSGVRGMKFRPGDELLAMVVVHALPEAAGEVEGDAAADDEGRRHLFVVFENGNAKRTDIAEYRVQGRAGYGIKVAADSERLGTLVGAVMVREGDEVLVVMERGKVVRSRVDDVGVRGRTTQGVRFARPDAGDSIIAITRNDETVVEAAIEEAADGVLDDADPANRAGGAAAPADGVPSEPDDSGDPAPGEPTGGEA